MSSAQIGTLEEAFEWSISRLARGFDLHRDTVRKRLNEAGVVPAGKKGGYPVYKVKDAARAILAPEMGMPAEGAGADPDSLPSAFERKAWFQSENYRVQLEKELRHLVPDHDHAREMSRLAKSVASALESLPDLLERDAGIEGEALDVVQRVVDELRERAYRDYVGDDDDV